MKTQDYNNEKAFSRIGWIAVAVGGLLFISLGLELLAHQAFGQTDVATLLLALYLAFWSSVLGIAGFLVLSILWFVAWRRPEMEPMEDEEDSIPVAARRSPTSGDAVTRSHDFKRAA
jgi:hypothetical protein